MKRSSIPLIVLCAGFLMLTACGSDTDAIRNDRGAVKKNSIAELVKLKVDGFEQWLLIRGRNTDLPVVLFLHGGPGFSELPLVRHYNRPLEDDAIFVQWEQPGAGKSYRADYAPGFIDGDTLVDCGLKITAYLKRRFGRKRIYLMTHCLGSILGVEMMRREPDSYIGYIGISQHVCLRENMEASYAKLMRKMKEAGNGQACSKLSAIADIFSAQSARNCFSTGTEKEFDIYAKWLEQSGEFFFGRRGTPPEYESLYLNAREYTLFEKLNVQKGPRLLRPVAEGWYRLNYKEECPALPSPVLFIMGEHDIHVLGEVTRGWYEKLNAPEKKMVVFENSAHFPHLEEADRFNALARDFIQKHGLE